MGFLQGCEKDAELQARASRSKLVMFLLLNAARLDRGINSVMRMNLATRHAT